MKQGSTLVAKAVVYLVGIAALTVCVVLLPELAREEMVGNSAGADVTVPFLTVAYLLATPFFVALYQTHKLLSFIDKKKFLSHQAIITLSRIKYCAVIFNVMIILAVIGGISWSRMVDPSEDVTFMVTIGFIFTFVASTIAIFVAVLQKLLVDAVSLKSENDLIV